MKPAWLMIPAALAISTHAHADYLEGLPQAQGPGLGTSSLTPAPSPGTPIWFTGILTFEHSDWIDVTFETAASIDPQLLTLQLVLTNSSGTAFDAFSITIDGPAVFSYGAPLPPPSLLPLGGPASEQTANSLVFDQPFWPGDADTNTAMFNIAVAADSGGDPVTIRFAPVPEPGSGIALATCLLCLARYRPRN